MKIHNYDNHHHCAPPGPLDKQEALVPTGPFGPIDQPVSQRVAPEEACKSKTPCCTISQLLDPASTFFYPFTSSIGMFLYFIVVKSLFISISYSELQLPAQAKGKCYRYFSVVLWEVVKYYFAGYFFSDWTFPNNFYWMIPQNSVWTHPTYFRTYPNPKSPYIEFLSNTSTNTFVSAWMFFWNVHVYSSTFCLPRLCVSATESNKIQNFLNSLFSQKSDWTSQLCYDWLELQSSLRHQSINQSSFAKF